MVKLQHKNIVRFITSWTEEEDSEDESLEQIEDSLETDLSIHFGNT